MADGKLQPEMIKNYLLKEAVGEDILYEMATNYLELFGTSIGIFDKKAGCVLSLCSSDCCQYFTHHSWDFSCRRAEDGRGKFLIDKQQPCRECGWNEPYMVLCEHCQPVELECPSGLRFYAVPIRAGEEIIGSIHGGYGDLPSGPVKVTHYSLNAKQPESRVKLYGSPASLDIEMVKKYLRTSAKLIGRMTEQKKHEKILQEREARLSIIMGSISDHMSVINKEFDIIRANETAQKVFGNDIVGKKCYDVYRGREEPCEPENCIIFQTLQDGKIHKIDTRITTKEGKTIYFHSTSNPTLMDKDGNPWAVIEIAKDTTEQKNLERQLRQAQKMEALGTMAGGIAHDFNNILGAIMGYTELAMDDLPETHPVRSNLLESLGASRRAADLIEQILAFSRQNGQQREIVSICLIIKEALKLLRSSLPATIEIRQNIKADSCLVMADPTQIHQVLVNLCTNAAHAMREKGGTLKVSLTKTELDIKNISRYPGLSPGVYLKLMISDTGHGISPEIIDQIFDPFFTTKGSHEGTGLGLSVVLGIVKSHGGTINVYSKPGRGTVFSVLLPHSEDCKIPKLEILKELPRGHERILLIDDEKSLVQIGKRMLGHLGYKVDIKTSAFEALAIFRQRPHDFDLVITDQTMPKMTGVELAQEFMSIRPDIPIILCTGFSHTITRDEAKAMGIKEFMMKPFNMRSMAEIIRTVLA